MAGRLVALAALAACGAALPEPERPGRTADSMQVFARVERATCGKQTFWCEAARGWRGGAPGELVTGPRVLVGVTIALEEGQPVEAALESVAVSVLVWRRHGEALVGRISELEPQNDEEKLETSEARIRIEAVLADQAGEAPLPPKLAADLKTFPMYARYALERDDQGWILRGQAVAEIRRVGKTWVVIEVPPKGPRGVFLSVFTERWRAGG